MPSACPKCWRLLESDWTTCIITYMLCIQYLCACILLFTCSFTLNIFMHSWVETWYLMLDMLACVLVVLESVELVFTTWLFWFPQRLCKVTNPLLLDSNTPNFKTMLYVKNNLLLVSNIYNFKTFSIQVQKHVCYSLVTTSIFKNLLHP